MPETTAPDPRPARRPGDGWVDCRCGNRHWGRYGAAGLLLWRRNGAAAPDVVLQHRALWSHHGGTWGLPGGAIDPDETDVQGALREAQEEADLPPSGMRVRAAHRLDHGDWSYTTVLAEAVAAIEPRVSDPESLGVEWVAGQDVAGRELLPAFADSLPALRELLARRLVLVVDGANTMGSRPDGWWNDRAAATVRLRDELAVLARAGLAAERVGLPGDTWYPQVVLVAEGKARGVSGLPGDDGIGGVQIVDAPGSGDEEILRQAEGFARDGTEVIAVTADRELRHWLHAVGASTAGPGLVLG